MKTRSVYFLLIFFAHSLSYACLSADFDYCASGDPFCSPGSSLLNFTRNSDECTRQAGSSVLTCLPLELEGVVTTVAGDGTAAYLDGTGTAAQLNTPSSLATDGSRLYVADGFNHRIRTIDIETSVVTTLAGDGTGATLDGTGTAAQINGPFDLTLNGNDLYVAETFGNRIRKIDVTTAAVTTVAGDGTAAFLDATGTVAQFNGPAGITTDGTALYVADLNNNRIRKIDITSTVVATLAGDGSAAYLDGTGTAAQFSSPQGIATDGTSLFVADSSNNRVRQIDIASTAVTTLAGDGSAGDQDGVGTAASFTSPQYVATDSSSLFFTDGNSRVRRLDLTTRLVTSLAGDGTGGYQDGTGTAAQFNTPRGIVSDGFRLFLVDQTNNRIRRID